MQAILLLILNPRLMYTYLHGFEIHSSDNIICFFFPQFFGHSMDFVEKYAFISSLLSLTEIRILVACLKYISKFPCPCCLIPKEHFFQLGTAVEMHQRISKAHIDSEHKQGWITIAHKHVFEHRVSVSGTITKIFNSESLTLTMVSFFSQLSLLNMYFQNTFS